MDDTKTTAPLMMLLILAITATADRSRSRTYVVVDTGQDHCYDNRHEVSARPRAPRSTARTPSMTAPSQPIGTTAMALSRTSIPA